MLDPGGATHERGNEARDEMIAQGNPQFQMPVRRSILEWSALGFGPQ
jgi:hypothetical protein